MVCQFLLQLFFISNSLWPPFPLVAAVPSTRQLSRPLASSCFSPDMLFPNCFFNNRKRMKKSFFPNYGLYLWLFSRWHPVLQWYYHKYVSLVHSAIHSKISKECSGTKNVHWSTFFCLLTMKGVPSGLTRCLTSKVDVCEMILSLTV